MRDIVEAGWPVGQPLGSEAELQERHQASRAVIREAIRLVEHHRVALTRPGATGGLIVRAPDADAVTGAVIVYLTFVGATLKHVMAARAVLEPLAAELAARRITEDGIARLREAVDAEAREEQDARIRNKLHLVIAEQCGNSVLELIIHVLVGLTWRYAPSRFDRPLAMSDAVVEAHRAHQNIAATVIAGDHHRARFEAEDHLRATMDAFLNHREPEQIEIRDVWAPPDSKRNKLAVTVAQRIFTEIARGGWPVGSVIGSEPDLQERFEVSKPTLREAVRLLEQHSVARSRTGPGGGLIVTEPDLVACVEAMALYLSFRGSDTEQLRATRQAVELAVVDRVTACGLGPQLAGRLLTPQPDPATDSAPAPGECPLTLHLTLAELSDNPVLAVFLRILITLWSRQGEDEPSAPPRSDPQVIAISDTHRRILDAFLAQDAGLARHRMHRHLEELTDWWQ